MKVLFLTSPYEEEWNRFIIQHPLSTIYHTVQWKKVTEETFGFTAYYLMVVSQSGIEAVLPGFLLKGKRLVSLPLRDRGGILSNSHDATLALCHFLQSEVDCKNLHSIELKEDPTLPALQIHSPAFESQSTGLRVIRQLPHQKELLISELRGTACWRSVRKSIREGVQVVSGEDADDWQDFYTMFLETRRRLGVPPYPGRLFSSIRNFLLPTGYVKLLMARKDRKNIAGMLLFCFNGHLIFAYGASRQQFHDSRPNDRLIFEAMQWGIDHQMKSFDFGSDDPWQKELIRFKTKWGSKPLETVHYVIKNRHEVRSLAQKRGPLFHFGSALLRRLPMKIYKRTAWLPARLAF